MYMYGDSVIRIINMTEIDVALVLPCLALEYLNSSARVLALTFTTVAGSNCRLSRSGS